MPLCLVIFKLISRMDAFLAFSVKLSSREYPKRKTQAWLVNIGSGNA